MITSGLYKNYTTWKRTLNVGKTKWRLFCIKHRAVQSLFIFSLSATLRSVCLTTAETLCCKVLSYFALKFLSLSRSLSHSSVHAGAAVWKSRRRSSSLYGLCGPKVILQKKNILHFRAQKLRAVEPVVRMVSRYGRKEILFLQCRKLKNFKSEQTGRAKKTVEPVYFQV